MTLRPLSVTPTLFGVVESSTTPLRVVAAAEAPTIVVVSDIRVVLVSLTIGDDDDDGSTSLGSDPINDVRSTMRFLIVLAPVSSTIVRDATSVFLGGESTAVVVAATALFGARRTRRLA